jgi:hypothetical protein
MSSEVVLQLLPEELQELADKTTRIMENAVEMQGDINAASVSPEKRLDLGYFAISELDKQAKGIFFNKKVQITGSYREPVVTADGENVHQTIQSCYGSKRGLSHGFAGRVHQTDDEPEASKFLIEHLINTGRRDYITHFSSLHGQFYTRAEIDESTLVLGIVEDHLQQIRATQEVQRSAKDNKWVDTFDRILLDPTGINIKQLGRHLAQLNLSRSHRTDDFISYINIMLCANANPQISVECDYAVGYVDGKTIIIKKPLVITGYLEGVMFGADHHLEDGCTSATELARPAPMLFMAAVAESNPNEIATLQIPLCKIRDFTIHE